MSPLISQPLSQWIGLGSTYGLMGGLLLILGVGTLSQVARLS